MKIANYLLIILLLGELVGCSSHTLIKIASSPQKADVFAINLKSQKEQKLGQTPLVLSEDKLEKLKLKQDMLKIVVRKAGYLERSTLLTDSVGNSFDLFFNLQPTNKLAEAQLYDQLSVDLFEVQRLIRIKDYQAAIKLAMKLNKQFPELSTPLELLGSAYYLQKKYKQAYLFFDQASKVNPQNTFSSKMKEIIAKKRSK